MRGRGCVALPHTLYLPRPHAGHTRKIGKVAWSHLQNFRVTLKVGMGKWGNGEMEEGTLLLLQSSNVMRKSMSIHALTERSSLPDSWHQRGVQRHCIMVCKLAICIAMLFTFGSLLEFLKFVESVNCSYFVPKESF